MSGTADEPPSDPKAAAVAASSGVPLRPRSRTKKATNGKLPRLASFEELPEFLKDNEFILGSYRTATTVRETWWTLFKFHNETGNVWSHLIAPLAFGRHQLEDLLSSMKGSIETAKETMQHGVHNLQDTLHSRLTTLQQQLQHMHALHGNVAHDVPDSVRTHLHDVQHGLAALQAALRPSALKDNLHHLSDTAIHRLQDNMKLLRERLMSLGERGGSAAKGLGEQLSHLAEALTPQSVQALLAAMQRGVRQQVEEKMKPIMRWPTDRWPMYVYTAGAMICLLTSSICHLFGCCSKHTAQMLWRFDYSGIAVLILTSFIPPIYYGFMCEPGWKWFYLICTSTLGVAVVMTSLLERFQTKKYHGRRAGLFLAFGLWGTAPVLHLLLTHWHIWHVRNAMILDVIMGATYVAGAIIYATRVPERWMPGRFDLALHSHQIFHLAVVIGALLHYRAVSLLLEWRDASGGCAAPINGPLTSVLDELRAVGGHLSMDQVLEAVHNTLGI